jgi:crotonobetainyl-CoA:carnitine CoA-transferase CaiB-like acyl-CoA transferase
VPSPGQHTADILGKLRQPALKPGQRASDSRRPLEGIRIIDLSMGWAGPLAARHLADLGADVIKVEACQYPDWWRGIEKAPNAIADVLYEKSVRFNLLQRGKRGITLDLTSREGVRLLKELVKTADALLENNSAGVLRKLGLEYERLIEVNPSIVMMSMSAYGSSGPWSDLRAYGSTLEQGSGLPGLAGEEGSLPVQTHSAGGDPIGGLNGCSALLTALFHRKRTGQGQFIDLSLVECMVAHTAVWALEQSANGRISPRCGNRHPHHVPHGTFRCAGDDQWLMIAVTDDAAWQSLCKVMERDDLARDPQLASAQGRRQREDELEQAIQEWTQRHAAVEAMMKLQNAGVAAGVAQSTADLLKDPHLVARGYWQYLERPHVGLHFQASAPFRENGRHYQIQRPSPTLGQYNEEVLKGVLGLTDADLKKLTADNVIGTTPILPEKRKVKVA